MVRVDFAAATAELAARDTALARVIAMSPPMRHRTRNRDGVFGALVRAIAFQQLGGKAATAIHDRFRALVEGPLTPDAVLALTDEAMRASGLSRAKTASIRDLAHRVASGTLRLDDLGRRSDQVVLERLVEVRGIGPWTAEMLLLFELRRPDVWPTTDLGVRVGYARIHALEAPPNAKDLVPLGDIYRPYRSIAAWYCWRAVDPGTELLP